MSRRELDVVILSDIHLGTLDCQAGPLLKYLEHIRPKTLVLNGDIIQLSPRRRTFPANQMKIVDEILRMSMQGTAVYLITGNRDDELRRYTPFTAGHLKLRDKLVLQLKGKQYWIFHGDVFDLSGAMTPWIVRLGSQSYRYLLRANRCINYLRRTMGKEEMSLSAKLRKWPTHAKEYIRQFESTAMQMAEEKGYDVVVCGHTHQPIIRKKEQVTYMNAGDWVENLTALEYGFGKWRLYKYNELDYEYVNPRLKVNTMYKQSEAVVSSEELFARILSQVNM